MTPFPRALIAPSWPNTFEGLACAGLCINHLELDGLTRCIHNTSYSYPTAYALRKLGETSVNEAMPRPLQCPSSCNTSGPSADGKLRMIRDPNSHEARLLFLGQYSATFRLQLIGLSITDIRKQLLGVLNEL